MPNTDEIARKLKEIAKSCENIGKAVPSGAGEPDKADALSRALRDLAEQLEDIAQQLRT